MKTIFTLLFTICAFTGFSQNNWEWTMQESGTNSSLRDLFFVNDMTGWVIGENGTILNTTDGGETWTPQTSGTVESLDAIHFIDENTGWIVGGALTSQKAPMLKTTDGGSSWQELSYDFNAVNLRDIFFVDENIGWVIKNDSIFRSTDGGETWLGEEYVNTVSATSLNHRAVYATSDSVAYVAGRHDNGVSRTSATVFDRRPFSSNMWGTDGANQFDRNEVLYSMTFANDSVGFIGGQMGRLYRMQQDGINTNGPWDLNLALDNEGIIHSISFPDSDIGMFNTSTEIDGTTMALVYHTEDQGDNWSAVPDTIPGMLSATLFAADEENAWMVAVGGKIYKGIRHEDPPTIASFQPLAQIKIAPNPFKNKLTIQLPDSYESIQITVSDITGKIYLLRTLQNVSNHFQFSELDFIPEGIYLLNITANNKYIFKTKKLIKH